MLEIETVKNLYGYLMKGCATHQITVPWEWTYCHQCLDDYYSLAARAPITVKSNRAEALAILQAELIYVVMRPK